MKSSTRQLIAEARAVRRPLALTVLLSVVGGLLIVGQAALLSAVIARAFLQGQTLEQLAPLLVGLLVLALIRAGAAWGATAAAGYVAAQVKHDLRQRLYRHLARLGPAYTRAERSGELVNTLTVGIEALDAFFRDYLPALFTAVLLPLIMLLFVFPLDPLTGIVLLLTAPLIPIFMALIGMAAGALARAQFGALSRLSAHFLDVLQGLPTLKLFNRSRQQIDVIRRMTEEYRDTTLSVLRVAFLSALALEMLATLSVAIVAVEISVRLLNGSIGFEQALFLLVIAPEFYQPLRALGAKFHAGTESSAAAARIFEVLSAPAPQTSFSEDASEEKSLGAAVSPSLPAKNGSKREVGAGLALRADDLHYAYGERDALRGLSFEAQAGQRIALVGPSGGGKSTVAALLLRFIAPDSGQIWVNGVPLASIDPDEWRARVAYVPQMPHLFDRTVAENIALGRPDAPLTAIIAAAEQAGAHDFITALPQGYQTRIGERGARLSGGQAQRIAIARAFLKDAPLLILDEPTANLDAPNEQAILETLERLMRGRTVIWIAHRLNTVKSADRILVVRDGRVAQAGDHESLIAQEGLYRALIAADAEAVYADG